MLRVLVCGSRDLKGTDADYMRSVLQQGYGSYEVIIQGDAPGADTVAKAWAWNNGVPTADFPAEWKRHGRAAGPIRNSQMLKEGKPDLVLAFTNKPLHESRGTRDMVGKASDAGVTVHHYRADKGLQEF